MNRQVPAVVLAGGPWKHGPEGQETALLDVAGRPMVVYVLDSLRQSEHVSDVCIVTSERVMAALGEAGSGLICRESGRSLVDNLLTGVDAVADRGERILIITCDVPLVTGPMIDRFIEGCVDTAYDFCYAVVSYQTMAARYGPSERTWVGLKDGRYSGGNLFLASGAFLRGQRERVIEVFAARKKPLQLVRMLGLRFLFKLLSRQLTVAEIEKRAEQLLRCQVKAIVSPDPEVAMDVDKVADLELVRSISLGTRAGAETRPSG